MSSQDATICSPAFPFNPPTQIGTYIGRLKFHNTLSTMFTDRWQVLVLKWDKSHQEFIIYIQRESVQCPYALYKHTAQGYDATFPYTLVYPQVKLTPSKCTKKVSINRHRLKATYFKLMCWWKSSQNWWRHCKILLFCINVLDLWHPWTMHQNASTGKFFGGELK